MMGGEEHNGVGWLLYWLGIAGLLGLLCHAVSARGHQAPSPWTPKARLAVARMCAAEAGWKAWKTPDCAAMAYVILKRRAVMPKLQGLSIEEVTRRYSVPMRARHARGRLMQSLPWAPLYGDLQPYSRDWIRILETVGRVANGQQCDPCTAALHFGSPSDGSKGRMQRVCKWLPTMQRYYRVRAL